MIMRDAELIPNGLLSSIDRRVFLQHGNLLLKYHLSEDAEERFGHLKCAYRKQSDA